MSFSSQMSELLREEMYAASSTFPDSDGPRQKLTPELKALKPIFKRQVQESIIPRPHQFLIETFKTRGGYHAVFYPFEGRFVHEAMSSLLAYADIIKYSF